MRLNNLLNDPDAFSEHIVSYLPLSIKKLIDSGRVTIEDIAPLIEKAIHESIRKDPQGLADILYPVMGPAIRKAVSEDIKRMLENVNTVLENSFSLKRLGWRLQAVFSGKSYAEIVLSHAFVYRVRQVFLIHRKTGLLLYDVSDTSQGIAQDADMVSAMLTAIKDFVDDSLNIDTQEGHLNTIQMGEYTIWIEQGPHAIIAAIIEGRAPEDLKLILKEALEGIHVNFIKELETFDGDTHVFRKTDRFLRMCMQKKEKEKRQHKPIAVIIILIVLVLFSGWWIYKTSEENIRFNKFVVELKNMSGVFINNTWKSGGVFHVSGLKDPDAVSPYEIAGDYGFMRENLTLELKPYISLDEDMVLKRAYRIINLPGGYKMSYRNDTLYVKGNIDASWALQTKKTAMTIPGISEVVFDKIVADIKPELSIKKEKVAKGILDIEKIYFVFNFNKIKLDSLQKINFAKLINRINTVYDFNFKQDSVPVIIVRAHTSMEGNLEANKFVAFKRAKEFIDFMIKAGIPMETLVPQVVINKDDKEPYPVRSVSFRVKYVKPEDL
jgi:OOP family OmpA-OmpF porin